ncbi:hypothetical protein [Cobetia amphilecti]|uniref:Uncharacterized protein n=1 Tax=Cobetia amphilecti TaxID=1055104 RepID=A0AAP4TUA8_9GAMM|nr:hypothetical protein [Cobetia amphilecti]MDO6670532.1 hypothetical protein [Cobetia amphilecti]
MLLSALIFFSWLFDLDSAVIVTEATNFVNYNAGGNTIFFVLFVAGVFMFKYMLDYLNPDDTKSALRSSYDEVKDEVKLIANKIEVLENKSGLGNPLLTESERNKLKDDLKGKILESSSQYVLQKLSNDYSSRVINDKLLLRIQDNFNNILSRLNYQVSSLNRRGALNLLIGIFTTIIAIYILYSTVSRGEKMYTDTASFLIYYIPRLSLSIFVEIFSFFFLRLYKIGLEEIKYFQNEMTNIELKLLALESAVTLDNESIIITSVNELMSTERNFKLTKDETTVSLEKYKANQAGDAKIVDLMSNILKVKS